MNREEYIGLRNGDREDIICYEYYKLKFDKEKHNKFLEFNDFIHYLVQWNTHQAIKSSTEHYDYEFNVISCPTKDKILYL